MQTFTQEQIMQYLYGEASPILKLAIDNAMKENIELQKEINKLKRTIKQLDKLEQQTPSQKSVDAILKYAKDTHKKK
jgi:regulator of replication initiation timing